jgi:membrane-bound lytic murein transglycosylase B
MLKCSRQFGALVVLIALAASASSQTAAYTASAGSVGVDFSSYHQALSNAADMALANVARAADVGSQIAGVPTNSTTQPDATILHQFAEQYWNGNDAAVRRAVARVTQLRPVLTPILREEGIPDELEALVLVESAGQSTALSPKGACGIWQFMPDTARRYGLTVNSKTDERLDMQKSTRAAARYLHDLQMQFGDWALTLAAYNAGEKLVQNAVLRASSKEFVVLSNRQLLPAETRAYVPAVLAASNLISGNNLFGNTPKRVLRTPAVFYASSAADGRQ